MKKKITALMALTVALTSFTAACGNAQNGGGESKGTTAATTTAQSEEQSDEVSTESSDAGEGSQAVEVSEGESSSAAESSASSDNSDNSDNSDSRAASGESSAAGDESKADDSSKADEGSSGGYANVKLSDAKFDDKYLYLEFYSPDYEPTKEEIKPLVKLVLQQYEASRQLDWKAYLVTENLPGLVASDGFRNLTIFDEDSSYTVGNALSQVISEYFWSFLVDYCEPKYGDNMYDEMDTYEASIKFIEKALAEQTEEEAQAMVENGTGIYSFLMKYDDEYSRVPSSYYRNRENFIIDDDPFIYVEVDDCEKVGDEIYLTFDMFVVSGERTYAFDEVTTWSSGGKYGVFVEEILMDDNPYPDYSNDELLALLNEEIEGPEE